MSISMFPTLFRPWLRRALTACLVIVALPALSAAIPAPNDTCANAIPVPAGALPYLSPVLDVLNATTNGDPTLPGSAQSTNVTRTVWFTFTPTVTALYTLSLGPDTATDFGDGLNDSVIAIFTSAGACATPFTVYDADDDAKGFAYPLAAAISTTLTQAVTYWIVVGVGQVSSATLTANAVFAGQPVLLQLRVTRPEMPFNDVCSAAEVIPTGGPFPYLTSIHDTTRATTNDPVSSCAVVNAQRTNDGQRSIWFKFTPAESGNYVISSSADTATTVGDSALALYFTSGGDCAGPLTHLTCDDNSFGRGVIGPRMLTAGFTYFIVVWDNSADYVPGETSVQLKVVRPGPPIVTTLTANRITTNSATLRAVINSNGGSSLRSRYRFEWGVTTNYTSTNIPILLHSTTTRPLTTSVSVSTNIFGFTQGTTYHFRAVATNELGITYGADQSFTWSGVQPTLAAATSVNDGFRFEFAAQPGQLYNVAGSTNLVEWYDLGEATESAAGAFRFLQPPAATYQWEFFRVRLP